MLIKQGTPRSSLICSVDDGSGQGGGGGGSGEKSPFSEDQMKALQDMSNATSSSHHTRINKSLEARLGEFESSQGKMLDKKFEELTNTLTGGGGKDAGKDGDKGDGRGDANNPEIAALTARVAAAESKAKAADQLVEQGKKDNLESEKTQKVATALRNSGVPDGLLNGAMAVFGSSGGVTRDDANKLVVRVERKGPTGPYPEDITLEDGVTEWLKTDNGKAYAGPRDVRGSGAQGGQRRLGPDGKPNRAEQVREAKHQLLRGILEDNM